MQQCLRWVTGHTLQDLTELNRAGAEKRERAAAARSGAQSSIEVQPNNLAPLLRDEKARRDWVEQELDICCQVALRSPPAPGCCGLRHI